MIKRTLCVMALSALGLAGCQTTATAPKQQLEKQSIVMAPAEMAFPQAGSKLRYEGERGNGNAWNWQGVVTAGEVRELKRSNDRLRSLFPGCLVHCNRTSHPFDEKAYAALFPLAIGKSATFVRKRADGSRSWKHVMEVTDTVSLKTDLGVVEAFEITSRITGVKNTNFLGHSVSYWAPSLRANVYERHWSERGSWKAEMKLVSIADISKS